MSKSSPLPAGQAVQSTHASAAPAQAPATAARAAPEVTGGRRLVLVLAIMLAIGFLANTLISYSVSSREIRRSIVENELPLTSDTLYSEIQKDLVRPIFVSSVMAGDTFLRDWVLRGERDVQAMTRFLAEIRSRYDTFTSFFVSETSRNYYHPDGVLRRVRQGDPQDQWYFRARGLSAPYEINVDVDTSAPDTMTVFVNYRVLDYSGNTLGVTGVGLSVDTVRRLLSGYQQRYHRGVYFVDRQGNIVLFGDKPAHGSLQIRDINGLRDIADQVLGSEAGSYRYSDRSGDYLLNVRYVPELEWYLFVEKEEGEALADLRRTLYLNLTICALVTLAVLALSGFTLARYQRRLEQMATTDRLTGLLNRHAFETMLEQTLADVQRSHRPVSVLLFDIDHFKNINDQRGHLAGDEVIRKVSERLRGGLRASDMACRWGGEEFMVVLKDCSSGDASRRAEALRALIAAHPVRVDDVELGTTVSAGVSQMRIDDTPVSLVGRVDEALYAAKNAGRDRVESA
ncbi:sensor domain-containing diguanylate cyclase [Methyloversatilis thermotolerans]|uniref:sensor domain-containing diguanylate cyclase n=1 Tax=Methyloversatilis thermotolerans TaxID=1346290 RepID=UPI0012F85D02|nr:sensor domain-containing diguanylate cyclase [Methyloversatilis thermotolerans]